MTASNPHAKRRPPAVHNEANMGRQSQQRIGNQVKRKFKLASNNNKKRKGGQQTLSGGAAFVPEKDCIVCHARHIRNHVLSTYRVPNRSHHVLCSKNSKTKGKGALTDSQLATLEDNQRFKALTQPITEAEKGSAKHLAKDGGKVFFAPRIAKKSPTTTTTTATNQNSQEMTFDFCQAVSKMVSDPNFVEKNKAKGAPLAMMAFANEVAEKIITPRRTLEYFADGIVMEVPPCDDSQEFNNPQCHSIIGQKLCCIDWERSHGTQQPCPDATCKGFLQNTTPQGTVSRSNYSKNKTLFPIFSLEDAPSWCIVMKLHCSCCKRDYDANDGEVLVNLPDHIADLCPVDTQCALSNFASHLSRTTTEVFSSIMLACGNGELCSKMLHNATNRAYIRRLKACCSKANAMEKKPVAHVEKDGCYVKTFPPLGDTVRDMWDASASSRTNAWRISDCERHTREIQGVRCENGIFCQDHTFEPIKNYQKRLGAKAAWTVGTGTGEIAAVALVPTTKTKDFSHAAKQLFSRPRFSPGFMHSDTWPNKNRFWQLISPGMEGRLGLFHYEQRIVTTLRKKHIDTSDAVRDLTSAIYMYHAPDYEKLLSALKEGTLSSDGHKYSSEEIAEMKGTKMFRDRYSKYLRKELCSTQTTIQNLDDWFCKHKVTSSDDTRPAGGRLDPVRMVTLFAADTKSAVANCKLKAQCLSDPLPLAEMCDEVLPNPNSKHQLSEFLSKRGESKLESFHDRFAHFANCGMRDTLADSLNLAGTARFNLSIRHKRSFLTPKNPCENTENVNLINRKKMPAGWEKVVPFYNQTELWYVNNAAQKVGCPLPFPAAEQLQPDNGERFFSQHMETLKQIGSSRGENDECLCDLCNNATTAASSMQQPPQKENATAPTTVVAHPPPPTTTTNPNRAERCTTPTAKAPQQRIAKPDAHRRVGAPAVTPQPPLPPTFPMIAPQPFVHHPPLHFYCVSPVTLPPVCCSKYKEWLNNRVGRPPHHPLCTNRQHIKQTKPHMAPL